MSHNKEMNIAWQFVEGTNISVFLTGKAGTGKTTFLRTLRERTPKRMVVVAPTGVAAINAGGVTIHSFFQLPLTPYIPGMTQQNNVYYKFSNEKKNIIRSMDLLVIDEISMVRSDVLDAIDNVMRTHRDRNKPFGGVQLLLIGDLQQLAPVAKEQDWEMLGKYYSSPYFFSSNALKSTPHITIELQTIYRQSDTGFINLLAKVRNNNIDAECIDTLNSRHIPDFNPSDKDEWIKLTTHNYTADQYNKSKLDAIDSPEHHFKAEIKGKFPETSYPADEDLTLKVGAQVMFIKNDISSERKYYNGKIGTITHISSDGISVMCKNEEHPIHVSRAEWENTKYIIDEDTKEIREEVEGVFRQYPLRLAWAITIHKSQGLTFDRAILDINDSFAHGQVYVALSRCRTLEGLVLSRPLDLKSVMSDTMVNEYISSQLKDSENKIEKLPHLRFEYFKSTLDELFYFTPLLYSYQHLLRIADEHLYLAHPSLLSTMKTQFALFKSDIITVADKFHMQYTNMLNSINSCNDQTLKKEMLATLQERIYKACGYFTQALGSTIGDILCSLAINIENKALRKKYDNAVADFTTSYRIKAELMKHFTSNAFNATNYLKAKSVATLNSTNAFNTTGKRKSSKKTKVNVGVHSGKSTTHKGDKEIKEKKQNTRTITFELYKQGKSPQEIARERKLTETTIYGHLTHYLKKGDLSIDEFVDKHHQEEIRSVVSSFTTSYSLTDIKNKLPDDYSFAEIRMVIEGEK